MCAPIDEERMAGEAKVIAASGPFFYISTNFKTFFIQNNLTLDCQMEKQWIAVSFVQFQFKDDKDDHLQTVLLMRPQQVC